MEASVNKWKYANKNMMKCINYSNMKFKSIRIFFLFICCILFVSLHGYGQNFTVIKSKQGVEILEKGKKVLFYQQQPKSVNGKYERAGYIHPLYSLDEKILTEESPEDHPYHRGIFWAWHQIILNNKKIADGWVSENISFGPAKVVVHTTNKTISLHAEMLWKYLPEKKKPQAIIRENTKITVHKSTDHYRAIDFDIRLYPLLHSLKIGGADDIKGYGGFCLRLKLPDDISFVSKNGEVIPKETAIDAGPWVDFIGSFGGKDSNKTGVAVFCDPYFPRSIQKWILRKKGSMQNIAYPGRTPIAIPEKGLRLKYRLIIHDDKISDKDLENLYQQYAGRP